VLSYELVYVSGHGDWVTVVCGTEVTTDATLLVVEVLGYTVADEMSEVL